MMYFLPDNIKTEALLKSGQQLIKDPSKWCKGAMQKGDSFCINGALFAVGTPNPRMPDEFVSEDVLYFRGCLLYTSPSPRDVEESRMPSSA